MQRSARPKSAKGRARPSPPSYPRSSGIGSGPSTSRAATRRATGYGRGRQTEDRRSPIAHDRQPKNEDVTENSASEASSFPDISRPVSSLSRYNILPRIPSSPGKGDGRSASPVESELELDLMSSFAQQMILDGARMNSLAVKTEKEAPPPAPGPSKRGATNNDPSHRRNGPYNQGSPVHKKSRTSAITRSVLRTHSNTVRRSPAQTRRTASQSQEPKEGEQRLKLALKFPDGKRMERFFAPTDTVNDIMNVARSKMRVSIRQCNVYSMLQIPKVLIKDWRLSLEQLDLRDRTVLYIEEKD